ncbi:MAG: sulfide/dihydroorotate dehydrogenase-like FAD/NAD-binding protein [Tissierellaceae bacterium]|nr:sulfide/dihydroorotate dehydrogenase-like FAD/NAD-binding protein [Tissierellaceae bacterium]
MYEIVGKELLAPSIYSMDILAPRVAKAAQPGQFVIVIVDENGERVPLTICDFDVDKGTVTIVTQAIGKSTKKLVAKEVGEYIKDFVGPLGKPSEFVNEDIEELKKKNILFAGGGVGVAPIVPQAKWLKEKGINFTILTGSKNKDFVILEDKFSQLTDNLFIATDDGSYGFHGFVNSGIEELVVNQGKEFDFCVIIGPMIMMKFTSLTTKKLGLPSIVSLNPIMVDGTGMCGACRVTVGGETKFACVDGPEFDGHLVDWDEALRRQAQYKEEEIQKDHDYCELVGGMTNE